MTALELTQPRPITWTLPQFPALRLAARLRLRGYPSMRRRRRLALYRWVEDYAGHRYSAR